MAAGCGRVDFDARGGGDARACTPIGHDEDGDGIDDGCDLCPQITGDPQVDSDGDGIGDSCDPNPGDPNDVLVFFDSFATPNPWQPVRGTWNVQDDALVELDVSTASSLATRSVSDPTSPDLTVDVVFTIDAWLPRQMTEVVADRGLGVWFVASGSTSTTDPTGYLCQHVEDIASSTPASSFSLYRVDPSGAPLLLSTEVYAAHTPMGAPGRIRVRRSSGKDAELCHLELTPLAGDLAGADTTYTTGILGIRTVNTAVHITSVTAYGRKP